jgi:hypothetical protein
MGEWAGVLRTIFFSACGEKKKKNNGTMGTKLMQRGIFPYVGV